MTRRTAATSAAALSLTTLALTAVLGAAPASAAPAVGTTPVTVVQAPGSRDQVVEWTPFTATYEVRAPQGGATPTGTMRFFDAGRGGQFDPAAPLGSAPLREKSPGVATVSFDVPGVRPVDPGGPQGLQELHDVVGLYSGDDVYAATDPARPYRSGLEVVTNNGEARQYVQRLYLDVLDRTPDAAGYRYWTETISGGATLADAAYSFSTSRQALALGVDRTYAELLERAPDADARTFYTDARSRGLALQLLEVDIVESDEYDAQAGATNRAFVTTLYQDFLGRSPDPAGLDYYTDLLDRSLIARGALAYELAFSQERLERVLNRVYLELLDRPVDAEGAAYWGDQIRAGYRLEFVTYSIAISPDYRRLLQPATP